MNILTPNSSEIKIYSLRILKHSPLKTLGVTKTSPPAHAVLCNGLHELGLEQHW